MGRPVSPLSRDNRARLLPSLQGAADAGSVAAAESLVRLSLIKEIASKDYLVHTGAAVAAARGGAAAE